MNDHEKNENTAVTPVGNLSPKLESLKRDLSDLSSPPHTRYSETTATIMSRVLIALLPALVWAIVIFGYRALTLTLVSVISCVMFEFLYQKILRRPVHVGDLSAVVNGVLISFVLPVNAPMWAPLISAAFAMIIVKQIFGGMGKNIVNPVAGAWVFLYLCFGFMRVFHDINEPALPAFEITPGFTEVLTPLVFINEGTPPPSVSMLDMFLGQHSGHLGEISVLLLLAGGIYLIIRKVITWHIPVSFVGTVALAAFLFPIGANHIEFTINQILSGGLLFAAFFMATDYATTPINSSGKLIFGAGCGLITISIRYFGTPLDGVYFAVMIMNMFVWYIDRLTKPLKFGGEKTTTKAKATAGNVTEMIKPTEIPETQAIDSGEEEGEE